MDIYRQDYTGAQRILSGLMQGTSDARPDAFFLSGVLNLKAGDYQDAEASFAAATDADPTRSEFFYFWGDCLRQEGKPQEAGARSARRCSEISTRRRRTFCNSRCGCATS